LTVICLQQHTIIVSFASIACFCPSTHTPVLIRLFHSVLGRTDIMLQKALFVVSRRSSKRKHVSHIKWET